MRSVRSARARAPRVIAALALALSATSAGRAWADDKEACVTASDQAQTLRDDGKYRAARAALLTCSRDVCPAIVRHDCQKWLSELDALQPTLVLGARDPKGNDFPGTHVALDGTPFVDHLDGKPVAVDPGEHVLRYEAPGATPVEQTVVARVNEKNRMLTVILMPREAAAPAPVSPPPPVEPKAPPSESLLSRVPVPAWVFAGVTVVAAGGFAGFGISGVNDVNNLRATCAPNCTQAQVDSARTLLNVADVSLGIGVVSLAVATWFFFHPKAPHAAGATGLDVRPDVQARPGGGVATISARF
ncbi:MAG: hypothetical protein ACLQVI_34955 [Polyangiaceae bacterium]